MKKFIEKYNLFFVVSIVIAVCVLLTWLFPTASYNNGSLVLQNAESFKIFGTVAADARIGIFDLGTYGILPLRYFTDVFIFLFIVAGFYKFIGTTEAYQNLTGGIAKKFAKKEKLFVAISTLFIAVLASLFNSYFALFAFIPFALSVLSNLKVEKISAICATFGGALIGILASTYSGSVAGVMANAEVLEVSAGNMLPTVLALGGIAYLLLITFTSFRMNSKKGEALVDPFAPSANAKVVKSAKTVKVSSIPLAIILGLLFVVLILGYVGWESGLGVTCFAKAFESIQNATIGGSNVFSYILGGVFTSFGNWDLYIGAVVILIATLFIKIFYRLPLAHVFDTYEDGFKKFVKTALIIMAAYVVAELTIVFQRIAGIDSFILGATPTSLNAGQLMGSGILTSLFTVDFQYLAVVLGSVFKMYADINVAALIMQVAYGFTMFVAPTSILLMAGLSLTNTKYTDWFKAMWKFLLALLALVIIVLIIVTMV